MQNKARQRKLKDLRFYREKGQGAFSFPIFFGSYMTLLTQLLIISIFFLIVLTKHALHLLSYLVLTTTIGFGYY